MASLTTQNCIDYCNQLLDKFGSPNAIDAEWLNYLNDATNKYINRLLPDPEDGVANYEQDKNITANLRPLIYNLPALTTTAGILTNATIDAALVTASGDAAASHFRIVTIGATTSGYPVKYVRHANYFPFFRNYFKKASATEPQYTQDVTGYPVTPVNNTTALYVTVLKKPNILALSPLVNPEFESYVMYKIIIIAVKLAGIAIRDEELERELQAIAK